MDQSRRAVEAYWRSRMVDGVTSDEDKVAPVYKLEEICELLRTSHSGIVKEVSDYVLKRLDHKSPIVKQKALRLIKYAVVKSGAEFRREMQRHSVAMRQLFHYKGQPDPLKGDALNKAVRDTAHEAIAALFAPDDLKAAVPAEGINKRIEGFGNTNYSATADDKKSFLSEVVGLGSASIKQGLSTIASAHSTRKNDNGNFSSYKSPTLRRSLTTEIDRQDGYQGYERPRESWSSSGISKDTSSGTWNQDSRAVTPSIAMNEDTGSSNTGVKNREEKLLETIVTSGGVRMQPTRDALQTFLAEALKLDAVAMSYALEAKLQSPLWQVRMKAICILESMLRRKDDEHFSIIASYFSEKRDSIVKCSELPQASLREKASKVLSLLDGDQISGAGLHAGAPSDAKSAPAAVQMPDLIDTGDSDEYRSEASAQPHVDQNIENLKSPGSLVDDLFGNDPITDLSTNNNRSEDDPFADVSFHTSEDKEGNIFSGLSIDNKRSDHEFSVTGASKPDLLDVFSANSEQLRQGTETSKKDVNDLISGLSLNGITQGSKQNGASGVPFLDDPFSVGNSQQNQLPASGSLKDALDVNALFTLGPMQQNMRQNMMFNQVYATQPMNYAAMGNFIAQQQLLFHSLGNTGIAHPTGNAMNGNYSSPIPDIFDLSNNPTQSHGTAMSGSNKEETKAFDFISDHVSAARGSKRVL